MAESTIPLPIDAVTPIVQPHLPVLSQVLTDAFTAYAATRDLPDSALQRTSASSRGMIISDLTKDPALQLFKKVPGVLVDVRHGRPWVNLDEGGRVQVRFRKLDHRLRLCPSDSDRAKRLAYHLGDEDATLPQLRQESTVLTAGYVLDAAQRDIERLALVCHLGADVHYWIPMPGGAADTGVVEQLPLAPLSDPVIRSARNTVAKKLTAKETGTR